MDCSICCEKFNKSTHIKVECNTCTGDTFACRKCCEYFLLNNMSEPKCMICKINWDKEFMLKFFSKKFINNEIKELKENILLEKEIAKLPETQEFAHNLKMIKSLEKQSEIIKNEKLQLKIKICKLDTQFRDIQESIYQLKHESNKLSSNKVLFTYKCPIDNCKGFLDESFHCGICDNTICKKCMEIKNEKHECDADQIETIKLIKKDTKPCPKCGQLINKIDGCDQMWCPPCHTPFSWKTGQIENGDIHNPEYYRWMRENNKDIPRNPRDEQYDPCGNTLPSIHTLLQVMRDHFPYKNDRSRIIDQNETTTIINIHRLIRHIEIVNRTNNILIQDQENELRILRASYLLNEINKTNWKKKLQILDKKKEKCTKNLNIWNLLSMVLFEYIGKIMDNKNNNSLKFIVMNIITESHKIRKYCNDSFIKIGKNYTCVYPGITDKWIQLDNYKLHEIKNK